MHPREADELLADLAQVRRRSRTAPGRPWPGLLGFGTATLGSAALLALVGPGTLAPYWAAVGVLGAVLLGRVEALRSLRVGIARRWRPAAALFAVCFALALLGAVAGGLRVSLLVTGAMVLAAYAGLGVRQHDALTPGLLVPGFAVAAVLALTRQPAGSVELALGASLVGAGAVLRAVERR